MPKNCSRLYAKEKNEEKKITYVFMRLEFCFYKLQLVLFYLRVYEFFISFIFLL